MQNRSENGIVLEIQDEITGRERCTNSNGGMIERRQSKRTRVKPQYLKDYVNPDEIDIANFTIDYCYKVRDVPKSYIEAIASPDSDRWKLAMEEEITALRENDTFVLTTLPEGQAVIGGRWVYAIKEDLNNGEKFKARFVAKGYSQIENVNYTETFSPTARITSVRMLVQLAVENQYIIHQMDVKTAYLNAEIDCDLYVEQPRGFVETNSRREKLVWRLKKALYGLKQSGRIWNNVLHEFLSSEQFNQSLCENCVYIRNYNGLMTTIIVWVDDLIICAPNLTLVNDVKCALSNRFRMKDLGQLKWFLGIEFRFKENCTEMNQSSYLDKILKKFGMSDCNPKSVPCDCGSGKFNDSESSKLTDPKLYREIVGSLIYLMTCTKPDICYAVTKLSQKLSEPTVADLNMSKFTLKYLKGSKNYGLKFMKSKETNLIGYCDSDWGGSNDRRSMSGYCFKFGDSGSLISWKCKKQSTVALSTCEAEYIALTYAIQEASFLGQLLSDMLCVDVKPVHLYVDNQGAIELAKNPVYHQRTKHIDIRYHFIRSKVDEKSIILHYIPTVENVADMFTKPVSKAKLRSFNVCS